MQFEWGRGTREQRIFLDLIDARCPVMRLIRSYAESSLRHRGHPPCEQFIIPHFR